MSVRRRAAGTGRLAPTCRGGNSGVSYLYLEEDDIVSGGYEELIADAAIELLEHLEHAGKLPKVLMIFVSCIDDLLGTDHEAIVQTLSEKRPDVRFTFCHMNPISMDTNVPPPVNIQNKIYSTLDPVQEKDAGINLRSARLLCGKPASFLIWQRRWELDRYGM